MAIFRGKQKTFDLKDRVKELKIPVLNLGSRYDALVPIDIQERDQTLMLAGGVRASLWILERSGHDSFYDSPACVEKSLQRFLAGHLEAKTYVCDPPTSDTRVHFSDHRL